MKNYLVLFLTITFYCAFAQSNSVNENLFKVNLLTPSLEYEVGTSKKTTLDFKIGTGLSVSGGSGRKTDWSFFPFAEVQYRYFYNFEKRLAKKKRTANNSGNYIALGSFIQSGKPIIGNSSYYENYIGAIGPVWGMQRSYKSGFSLNLYAGPGYSFSDKNNEGLVALINFSLGWVIGK